MTAHFAFDNSYARLPERFYARLPPSPVVAPTLIRINEPFARYLGLDPIELSSPEGIAMLAGNRIPEGAEPLAMAYAGHQFGNWVPQLGDGRAVLLGEVRSPDGVRWDIQLKGAGRTPFSRQGDGRAALGPVLREYIVSEAMAALGVPTTRALAMVTTGEEIVREGYQQGAILTRVARSHVRVGTFEYFANRGDVDAVRLLADYVIARLYPDAANADQPYRALLDALISRQARLVAQWLGIGFIHGVMNTDNTSISGETIDYGPCAFMDEFHPARVYSSIDQYGRYAYGNQPGIMQWNLAQFAQALMPLLGGDETRSLASAQEAIDAYPALFREAYSAVLRAKIGLADSAEDDGKLAQDLLKRMADNGADFTLTFRRLCDCAASGPDRDGPVRELFHDPSAFDGWAISWRERLSRETRDDANRASSMRAVNPAFIPRNHRIEAVIQAAAKGNFDLLDQLLAVLARPYDDQPEHADYAKPPRQDEVVQQTFCGT